VNTTYPIVGDVKNVAKEMLELVGQVKPEKYEAWRETVGNFAKLHPLTFHEDSERIKPQWVVQRVGELLGDSATSSVYVLWWSWNNGIWFSGCNGS